MINRKILVLPDIHGRKFWKTNIEKFFDIINQDNDINMKYDIIFLGDYVDPYVSYDGISTEDAYENFIEIINWYKTQLESDFIRFNKLNIHMLFGNHDWHYVEQTDNCRIDTFKYDEYKNIFKNAIWSTDNNFRMNAWKVFTKEELNCKYTLIFSHAGFVVDWINELYNNVYSFYKYSKLNEKTLNSISLENKLLFLDNWINNDEIKRIFKKSLGKISKYRGGWNWDGSCIWADMQEIFNKENKFCDTNMWQIFGHTYARQPIIDVESKLAMLDYGTAGTLIECDMDLEDPIITKMV